MTDLDLLTSILDKLNVYYEERDHTKPDGELYKLIDLQEAPRIDRENKIPYDGYDGFAWIFKFNEEGKLLSAGGYE